MTLAEIIGQKAEELTKSERRVAEILLQQPKVVAFGTVSDLAQAADSGVATVARLSSKLGFNGFSELQQAVRHDIANLLEPAALRIKEHASKTIEHHLQIETRNLQHTLNDLDSERLSKIVAQISQLSSSVYVLSGNASRGVAQQFFEDLCALRPDVYMLEGNPVQVSRTVAQMKTSDVMIAIDLRRYDRWVLDAAQLAHGHEVEIVAIADSVLSPLAKFAQHVLVVSAAGAGPFDSHVGTLALLNVLIAGVAEQLKASASNRLNQAENTWRTADLLIDR